MLSHLVYVSKRNAHCTDVEIEKILASCHANNGEKDITGVLLYSDKTFVQYLEGGYKEITSLFDKIKEDDRHSKVAMVGYAPIKERLFPSWKMGSKKFNDESVEFISEISSNEAQEFKDVLSGKEQKGTKAMDLLKKFFH